MAILYCGAKRFKQIILAGAEWVVKNRDHLNKINVFPVPDGDTGTNMSMTLVAAAREVEALQDVSLETTVKAAAWGSLMGARGNSGIILAQILSGVAEGIEGRERLFAEDVVSAFSCAVRKAYKAILHPTEGTILTVLRDTAETAQSVVRNEQDLVILLNEMVRSARASVDRTPLLLPRLKEAGVVDAGGLGFFYFLEGMVRLIRGDMKAGIAIEDEDSDGPEPECVEHRWNQRYCTEFILKGSKIPVDNMKENLVRIGDSIVIVGDTRLARVHVHTNEPDEVLHYASSLGQVSSVKVDDMLVQHTSRLKTAESTKPASVIAVVLGDGLKEIFYNAGSELVVEGGPTQNPSISDIVSAIETVASAKVIILPNHKNIYPAALQAAAMTPKEVKVLKTCSMPEGLSALLAYTDDAPFEVNLGRMEEGIAGVKSGEVALASREVTAGDVEVKTGDSIGIYMGEIRCSSASVVKTVLALAQCMVGPDDEIITLFHGDSIENGKAEDLRSALQDHFQDKAVELYYGGQPHAQYIISVE